MEYHYPRVVIYQSLSSDRSNGLLLTPDQTDSQDVIMMRRSQATQDLAGNVEDMHENFIDSQLAIDYGELLDEVNRDIIDTEEHIESANMKKKCNCCTKLIVLLTVSCVVAFTLIIACIIIFALT